MNENFDWEAANRADKVKTFDIKHADNYVWVDFEKREPSKYSSNRTPMRSKFDGQCVDCNLVIKKDQWMVYDGKAHHVSCIPCDNHIIVEGYCHTCEDPPYEYML